MKRCTRCQSYAINPSQHGRDGTRLDLCDVCYWRDTAETRAARVAELEARIKRLEEAGDAIVDEYMVVDPEKSAWRQAKEAKP